MDHFTPYNQGSFFICLLEAGLKLIKKRRQIKNIPRLYGINNPFEILKGKLKLTQNYNRRSVALLKHISKLIDTTKKEGKMRLCIYMRDYWVFDSVVISQLTYQSDPI